MTDRAVTVVGGAGFVGSAVARRAVAGGRPVISLDRVRSAPPGVEQQEVDLLVDPVDVPDGLVVLAAGNSDPGTEPWRLVLDNAVTTARILPALRGRDVVLISSPDAAAPPDDALVEAWCVELLLLARRPCPPWQVAGLCRELIATDPAGAYGMAARARERLVRSVVDPQRLTVLRAAELFGPGQDGTVARLTRRALAGLPLTVPDSAVTLLPVDDLAAVALAAEPGTVDAGLAALPLVELAALILDTLGLDLPVQVVPAAGTALGLGLPVEVVPAAGTALGLGLPVEVGPAAGTALGLGLPVEVGPAAGDAGRVDLSEFLRRLGVGDGRARLLRELRSYVGRLADEDPPAFVPALPVVLPPKPRRPDEVAYRTQACLETGAVRGGPWAGRLADGLRETLELPPESALLLVASGSAALRLAVQAIAGPARPGDVAVLPSFTFAATAEMLAQLGYTLRFCDVRPDTWTMDPASLAAALAPGDATVVVTVDALGAPADYAALTKVCADAGVPLVGDSAAALGAGHQGRPVATQAAAHSYSLSFAKVLSAGGGGGALVLPAEAVDRLRRPVDALRSVPMVETAAIAALDLLGDLPVLVERRREVARRYGELASAAGVVPQQAADGDEHAWVHWVARFSGVDRDRLAAELLRLGVATKPYYAPPLHWHDWGAYGEPPGPLPVADLLGREALALPMSSELTPRQADRVTAAVLRALEAARR